MSIAKRFLFFVCFYENYGSAIVEVRYRGLPVWSDKIREPAGDKAAADNCNDNAWVPDNSGRP